jgi:hypothetical protein
MTIDKILQDNSIRRVWELYERFPETHYRGDVLYPPESELATMACVLGAIHKVYGTSLLARGMMDKLNNALGHSIVPWNDTNPLGDIIKVLKQLNI